MRVGRLHRSDQGLGDLPAFTVEPLGAQDAIEPTVRFAVRHELGGAALMFVFGAVFVAISVASIVSGPSLASVAWSSLFLIVGLVVISLAAAAIRGALRGRGQIALARDGLLIVGRDLEEPIPVRGTSFEVRNIDGSPFVALRRDGEEQLLTAYNWRPPAGTTLREALLALGLTPVHREPLTDSDASFAYGETWGTRDRVKLVGSIVALAGALALALSGDGSGLALVLAVCGGFACIGALRDLWQHRRRTAAGLPALTREGDELISAQLDQRLPVHETTFRLSFEDGHRTIVLRTAGVTASLDATRWITADGSRVTKAAARDTLLRMGLEERRC